LDQYHLSISYPRHIKRLGWKSTFVAQNPFSQGSTGLTGAHYQSDRWWPWSHIILFLRPKWMQDVL
jgi:hypothetical protein